MFSEVFEYFSIKFVSLFFLNFRLKKPIQRENLGIIVQYKVKVKLCLGPLGGDLVAELPFTLMHPEPEDNHNSFNNTLQRNNHLNSLPTNNGLNNSTNNGIIENLNSKLNSKPHLNKNSNDTIEQNLIQLDT